MFKKENWAQKQIIIAWLGIYREARGSNQDRVINIINYFSKY